MAAQVLTASVRVAVWDEANKRWGSWTGQKQLLELSMTIPDPTVLRFTSSAPDDSFGQELDAYPVPGGSPQCVLRSQDMADRSLDPPETLFQELAMAAIQGQLDQPAATEQYVGGYVDSPGRAVGGQVRNIGATPTVYSQASGLNGLMAGSVASADATTLTVNDAGWTVDELNTASVLITTGAGAGEIQAISSNTADTLTVASWSSQPDGTSSYAIVDGTPLTLDADYSVDQPYGMIIALPGGSVAAGATLHAICSTGTIQGQRFRGGARQTVVWRATGPARDQISGADSWILVPKVRSFATEAAQFVTDAQNAALQEANLSGSALIAVEEGYDASYLFDDNLQYGLPT